MLVLLSTWIIREEEWFFFITSLPTHEWILAAAWNRWLTSHIFKITTEVAKFVFFEVHQLKKLQWKIHMQNPNENTTTSLSNRLRSSKLSGRFAVALARGQKTLIVGRSFFGWFCWCLFLGPKLCCLIKAKPLPDQFQFFSACIIFRWCNECCSGAFTDKKLFLTEKKKHNH